MSATPFYLAYIGIGANLGDRVYNLVAARQQLNALAETRALRSSSLYLSSPVGDSKQPNFINCVVEMEITRNAEQLFEQMQMIENRMGRKRNPDNQNAPRSIDLDLLLFGDLQSDDSKLTIPHPRLTQRLFVVAPLIELDSELDVPGLGRLRTLVKQGRERGIYSGQTIHRFASNW